jgi:hypothetical protein
MVRKSRSWEKSKLFTEDTVQLWVYELLCTGDDKIRRKILGRHFGKIKVVIPEYPLPKKGEMKTAHNTDFRIVFSDGKVLNVEVEWQVGSFKSHGKATYDEYYSSDKGIIIALEDDEKLDYIDRNNVVTLSANKFSFWFSKRARSIADTTISNKLDHYTARKKKIWMLGLAKSGMKGGESLNDYLDKGRKKKTSKGCWAFRYTDKSECMRNILDIKTGDYFLFMYDFKYKHRKIKPPNQYDWSFRGFDLVKITNGFHIDFEDKTFEKPSWPPKDVENKEYMHYIEFEFPPKPNDNYPELISVSGNKMPALNLDDMKELDRWDDFCMKLSKSIFWNGFPIEISEEELSDFLLSTGDQRISA